MTAKGGNQDITITEVLIIHAYISEEERNTVYGVCDSDLVQTMIKMHNDK